MKTAYLQEIWTLLSTGDDSLIHQYTLEIKCQSTIWVFPNKMAPTEIKRTQSADKKMAGIFLSASDTIAKITLDTVNSEWCVPRSV